MNAKRYALISAIVLIPCFWQTRIQAGDLGSHIYNAWLAQLVAAGHAPGLRFAFQTTNVLFDWVLAGLQGFTGAAAAQRISVSLAVLIFVWGAFSFIRRASGQPPWTLAPLLMILAYGWVFHAGFFNFYISLGLCFWAMSLVQSRRRLGAIAAILLFALAWLAHNLPVLWALWIAGYTWIASRWDPHRRFLLVGVLLSAIVFVHLVIRQTMAWWWSPIQFQLTTGADQAHVWDGKYYLVSAGILSFFFLHFTRLVSQTGLRKVLTGIPFQICFLTAAFVAIIPSSITGPGFQAAFIADRMSLPLAICICAMIAPAIGGRAFLYSSAGLAALYFGMLYRDDLRLNRFEDQLQLTVAQLPPTVRVISGIDDFSLHTNALTHMIDRVCIGRCYSYANYEPGTGNFRIRTTGRNPIVAANYGDSWGMQTGGYVVKPHDLPLYWIGLDATGKMILRELKAGEITQTQNYRALPDLF